MNPDSDKTHSGIVRFWRDDSGFLSTVDYLVLVSVIAVGSIVGLTEVRTSLVQIMGDVAGSLENINQSYSFSTIGSTSIYIDTVTSDDTAGMEPQGISVQQPPTAGG